jgi:hypothetical protein
MYHLRLQGRKSAEQETSVQQVESPKMGVILSSKTSVHTWTRLRCIAEDGSIQKQKSMKEQDEIKKESKRDKGRDR